MAQPAQPNFTILCQRLIGISEQINLLPNMPAIVGLDAIVAKLDMLALQAQQHQAALAQQAQQHQTALAQQVELHRQLKQRLDAMELLQRNLPRQLQNLTASLEAPLVYPPNVNASLLPRTKRELLGLDLAGAQAAAQTLGLPPIANPTAAQCRQYVFDFIGCAMTG